MKETETKFQKAERVILQVTIVILLLLTLFRIVWSEVLTLRETIFREPEIENSTFQQTKQ